MRSQACLITCICLLAALPAWAQAPEAGPTSAAPNGLELAATYQSGYLQVVAVSCYQLYSSTGIIQTNLVDGMISPATALTALEHNSLLQSVCLTTLSDIRALTPDADAAGQAELDRLLSIATTEGELLRALQDYCTAPSDATATALDAAQQQVEAALTAYAGENPLGLKAAPDAGG
jgi:hypothetical protein